MSLPNNKYSLAIHTSSSDLGFAISNFDEDTRCQKWNLGRDLSIYLHQYLREFIQPQTWEDLAFIAVAKGPGGFTGTRMGVVTARTLAQQLNIPLFGISSLAAVAWDTAKKTAEIQEKPTTIAVQMRARREQLFGAIYEIEKVTGNSGVLPGNMPVLDPPPQTTNFSLKELLPETLTMAEDWEKTVSNWHTSVEAIQAEGGLGGSVLSVLELAYKDWEEGKRSSWSEVVPFYGQHPVEQKR
ncbi:MAG: tRNA (adenosine(37)-N6)-threonylcarbamoyltransferase complex dimerization subunit type 1 TsaB [Cyanobacteriota bacterium]|nr:tRNA (adenosine(37)-N6)-threonylcarbamoyltransferase complex dimerization subunit type 1 TsaB [Cyanobacteriota bacterium]